MNYARDSKQLGNKLCKKFIKEVGKSVQKKTCKEPGQKVRSNNWKYRIHVAGNEAKNVKKVARNQVKIRKKCSKKLGKKVCYKVARNQALMYPKCSKEILQSVC